MDEWSIILLVVIITLSIFALVGFAAFIIQHGREESPTARAASAIQDYERRIQAYQALNALREWKQRAASELPPAGASLSTPLRGVGGYMQQFPSAPTHSTPPSCVSRDVYQCCHPLPCVGPQYPDVPPNNVAATVPPCVALSMPPSYPNLDVYPRTAPWQLSNSCQGFHAHSQVIITQ